MRVTKLFPLDRDHVVAELAGALICRYDIPSARQSILSLRARDGQAAFLMEYEDHFPVIHRHFAVLPVGVALPFFCTTFEGDWDDEHGRTWLLYSVNEIQLQSALGKERREPRFREGGVVGKVMVRDAAGVFNESLAQVIDRRGGAR